MSNALKTLKTMYEFNKWSIDEANYIVVGYDKDADVYVQLSTLTAMKYEDAREITTHVVSHTSVGTGEAYVLYQIDDGIKAKWISFKELERMQEEVKQ